MIQIDPKTVFSLKDRVAIVTGGAIGLGKTIAEFYAAFNDGLFAEIELKRIPSILKSLASKRSSRALGSCRTCKTRSKKAAARSSSSPKPRRTRSIR